MKVRPSVKPICEKCKIIKRKGKVMVICKTPAISRSRVKQLIGVSRVRQKSHKFSFADAILYG